MNVEGKQQHGTGAALELNVTAPDGVYATQMIWAIRYKDNGVERVKYTDPVDVENYGIGTTLKGKVVLGVAFRNGFKGVTEMEAVEVTDVDAIFLFTNGEEVFTEEKDMANRRKQ